MSIERQIHITLAVEDREDAYSIRTRGSIELYLPATALPEVIATRVTDAAHLLVDAATIDHLVPEDPHLQAAAPGVLDA